MVQLKCNIMKDILPENLKILASRCPFPLYVVGGAVRDFLRGEKKTKPDWDICAPAECGKLKEIALSCGFSANGEYPLTASLKLKRGEDEYEFTSFRTDEYGRSGHAPSAIALTDDIVPDARRRDFTCNAVYYDICAGQFADPLGGMTAIAQKKLVACKPPDILFGEDGERILRLARFTGELGFSADGQTLAAARRCAHMLQPLSPARIWREISRMLICPDFGAAFGTLSDCGCFKYVFPSLFPHDKESIRRHICAVQHLPPDLRLAGLLMPLGGEGAKNEVSRYPLSKSEREKLRRLITCAAYDGGELPCFIAGCRDILPEVCVLAASAGREKEAQKWQREYDRLRRGGVPMELCELEVRGDELIACGVPAEKAGKTLELLLKACLEGRLENSRKELIEAALEACGKN